MKYSYSFQLEWKLLKMVSFSNNVIWYISGNCALCVAISHCPLFLTERWQKYERNRIWNHKFRFIHRDHEPQSKIVMMNQQIMPYFVRTWFYLLIESLLPCFKLIMGFYIDDIYKDIFGGWRVLLAKQEIVCVAYLAQISVIICNKAWVRWWRQ